MAQGKKLDPKRVDTRFSIVDTDTPRNTQLTASYKRSLAYYDLKDNLPVILTNIIDTLAKDKDELAEKYGGEVKNDCKKVIARLSKIKYELQTNKRFLIFENDEPDKKMWNRYIENLSEKKRTFFGSTWIDAETYLYRKIQSFFENTYSLKDFDYFAKKKQASIVDGSVFFPLILHLYPSLPKGHETLESLLQFAMWYRKATEAGKMLANLKPEQLDDGVIAQKADEIFHNQEKLIANDTEQVWDCLMKASLAGKKEIVVHLILNNCDFELFALFLLATFLVDKGLATTIVFHPKAYPYCILDATFKDLEWFLDYMTKSKSEIVRTYGEIWLNYFGEGKFKMSPKEYFWTSPYSFYKMRDIDPKLYNYLKCSELVIFTGDMNYRKLLGDYYWEESEDFITTLRGFLPTNLLAVRAITSTIICGVDADITQAINKQNKQWMVNGDYGVIQFCEAQHCNCEQPGDYLPDDEYFNIYSDVSETCSEKLARLRLLAEEEGCDLECEPEEELEDEEDESSSKEFKTCCYDGTKPKPQVRFVMRCRKVAMKYRDMSQFRQC